MNRRKTGEKTYFYAVKIAAETPLSASCAYSVVQPDRTMSYEQFDALKRLCDVRVDLWETVSVEICGKRYIMLVDEDGKNKDLPVNPIATDLYRSPYDVINGDAFLVQFDGVESLTFLDDRELDDIDEMFEFVYAPVGEWHGLSVRSLDNELANLRA